MSDSDRFSYLDCQKQRFVVLAQMLLREPIQGQRISGNCKQGISVLFIQHLKAVITKILFYRREISQLTMKN